MHRNRVSVNRRPLVATCMQRLLVRRLLDETDDLMLLQAGFEHFGEDASEIATQIGELLNHARKMVSFLGSELPRRRIKGPGEFKRFLTIAGALNELHDNVGAFERNFGVWPEELRMWLERGVMGTEEFVSEKRRGRISPEAGLLIVLGRLRNTKSTWVEMGTAYGVDAAFLSEFFNKAVTRLYTLHAHRLDLANIMKWAQYFEDFRAALARMYEAEVHEPMPAFFQNVCLVIDAVRLMLARAQDYLVQELLFNSYVGGHNVGFIGLTAPNGMVVALSRGDTGSANDPGMVISNNLPGHLALASAHQPLGQPPVKVLGDKAFGASTHIAPFPKENTALYNQMSDIQRNALSKLRVIVEWSFGEVQEEYPYVKVRDRQKIGATIPIKVFTVACFLRNLKRIGRGSNATLYMGVEPPSWDWYMSL